MTTCPHCGKDIGVTTSNAKPWNNAMSVYVNPDGTTFGLMNDDAEKVVIPASSNYPKGLTLTRKDVFDVATRKATVAANQPTPQAKPNTNPLVPPQSPITNTQAVPPPPIA